MNGWEICLICHRENLWETKKQKEHLSHLPKRVAKEIMEFSFPNLPDISKGVYIYGFVKTGKTLRAAKAVMEQLHHEYVHTQIRNTFAFVETSALLQQIKNTYNAGNEETEQSIIEKYQSIDYLIFDDIGVQKTSDWAYTVLYLILNYRYENYKTTIFTSNCSLDDLSGQMGDDRIVRRIMDMCAVIEPIQ